MEAPGRAVRGGTIAQLRLCIDANCLLTGLTQPGSASWYAVRAALRDQDGWAVTAEIIAEYRSLPLRRSVQRFLLRRQIPLDDFIRRIEALQQGWVLVTPVGEAPPCRDEDDRKYLHCAVTAGVDALVSVDRDLLDIGAIEGIPIVTPPEFLALARRSGWEIADPR